HQRKSAVDITGDDSLVEVFNLQQLPQMLSVPEHERPMRGERKRADEDRQDRDAANRAAEQLANFRMLFGLGPRCMPFLWLRYGAANPERQKSRQHANQEHGSLAKAR